MGKDKSSSRLKKDQRFMQDSMSRIHTISKSGNIPIERVDSFEDEKNGPVLDAKIYPHEAPYCIDIMNEGLFRDKQFRGFVLVNGINKYVAETSEEIPTENVQLFLRTGKPVAMAKPRPKLVVNLSSNYVPIMKGDGWTLTHNHSITVVFAVSKFIIRRLLHDSSILRESAGAVKI